MSVRPEINAMINELASARLEEQSRLAATLRRLEDLASELEDAQQRLDEATDLLGECLAIVGPEQQASIAETVEDWPAAQVQRLQRAELGARSATATRAMRRAS